MIRDTAVTGPAAGERVAVLDDDGGLRSRTSALGWAMSAVTVVLLVLLLTPFATPMPNASLDGSWAHAMNMATTEHLRFGKDIVFTFGPLAAIYTNVYHPGTDVLMLVGSFLLALALSAGLIAAVRPDRRPLLLLFPLAIGLIWLPYGTGWRDATLMLVPLLLPLVVARGVATGRLNHPVIFLLAATIPILPLVKASFSLTSAVASLIAILLCWRAFPRTAIAIFLAEVVSLILVWLIAGQALLDLPGYFIAQAPIVSGYTNAMSSPGDPRPMNIVFYIAAAVLLLAISLKGGLRRNWHVTLLIALYLFVAFKSGFVRGDQAHAQGASTALMLLGVVLFLTQGREYRRGVASLSVGLAGSALIVFSYASPEPVAALARLGNAVKIPAQGLWVRLTDNSAYPDLYEERINQIRAESPFMGETGQADLYPHDLGLLLVTGAEWKPRPVLQSYSAYTPSLLRANADHLREAPPARIYFKIDPIDGRYPSLDDGASWLELLGKYEPKGFKGGYAVLERRTGSPAALKPQPVRSVVANFDEVVPVPNGAGPVWATLDIKPTLLGKLFSAVYKAPQLKLEVKYADGGVSSYRMVAGMGATGFLLSPSVIDANGFVSLSSVYRDELPGQRKVVSMAVRGDPGSDWMWKRAYQLQLSSLNVPSSSDADAALTGAWKDGLPGDAYPAGGNCNIEEVSGVPVGVVPLEFPPRLVKVRGWAALDAQAGKPNQGVSLLAAFEDGRTFVIPAIAVGRLDVANYFGHPELGDHVGYEAYVDVRKLQGLVHFRVLQNDEGVLRACHPPLLSIRRQDATVTPTVQ